jgi:hypothetical protein
MTTGQGASSEKSLRFEQSIAGQNSIDSETRDDMYIVKIPYKFLEIVGETYESKDNDDIAHYVIRSSGKLDNDGSYLTIKLKVRSLSNNLFKYYGDQGATNQITTTFSVQGLQSGARKDMTVVISQTGV